MPEHAKPDSVLTEDQKAYALQRISDVSIALATLHNAIKFDTAMITEIATTALSASEAFLADLGQSLQIDTNSAQALDERFAEIREANQKIRALKAQLANKVTPSAAQQQLTQLSDKLSAWWRKSGFGHVSSINFGGFGAEVVLSCHLTGPFRISSHTPVSDAAQKTPWLASLKERGFKLNDAFSKSPDLLDCDSNRQLLHAFVKEALPSAQLISYGNRMAMPGPLVFVDAAPICLLIEMTLTIRQLDDICNLVIPQNDPGT